MSDSPDNSSRADLPGDGRTIIAPSSEDVRSIRATTVGDETRHSSSHDLSSETPAGLSPHEYSAAEFKLAPLRLPEFIGAYQLEKKLGQGGMGVVYQAKQLTMNRTVALKMIVSGPHASPQMLARFSIEVHAIARLQHESVIRIYELGEYESMPFYSMEFIDGGSLASQLAKQKYTPRQAAELVRKLAIATHYAHGQNVLHRDLKPANILMTQEGEPKIADFGLAKLIDVEEGITRPDMVLGTPNYMAPEQAEGRIEDICAATDVYALGAILYECLTGARLFQKSKKADVINRVLNEMPAPPSKYGRYVPSDLDTICLKCLEKNAANRYPSAGELAEDIDRYLRGLPIKARPTGILERSWRWARRHPQLVAILLLLILGTGVSSALAILSTQNAHKVDENETKSKKLAYIKKISDVQAAWRSGKPQRVQQLLDEAVPKNGEADRRGFEWFYWHNRASDVVFSSRHFKHELSQLAFSPSGNWLAMGAAFAEDVKICDADNGTILTTLDSFHSVPMSVAWSPDETMLAVGTWDGQVEIWDTSDYKILSVLEPSDRSVMTMAWRGDGKRLACASMEGTVKVFDMENPGEPEVYPADTRHVVLKLAYQKDTLYLAAAQFDASVEVTDVLSGKVLKRLEGITRQAHRLAWSPSGRKLAACSRQGEILAWEVPSGNRLFSTSAPKGFLESITWNPTESLLAVGDISSCVEMRETKHGKVVDDVLGTGGRTSTIAWRHDGRLAISDYSGALVVQKPLRIIDAKTKTISAFAVNASGTQIVAASADGTLEFFDAASRKSQRLLKIEDKNVDWLAFAGSGKQVVAAQRDGTIKVYSVVDEKAPSTLPGGRDAIACACVSASGQLLGVVSKTGQLAVWDLAHETVRFTTEQEGKSICALGFSEKDDLLLAMNTQGVLLSWKTSNGEPFVSKKLAPSAVTVAAFDTDGRHVAFACESRIMTTQTSTLARQNAVEIAIDKKIVRMAFAPEGGRLAAFLDYDEFRMWDTETGQTVLSQAVHTTGDNIRFGAQGKILVGNVLPGALMIWDASTPK